MLNGKGLRGIGFRGRKCLLINEVGVGLPTVGGLKSIALSEVMLKKICAISKSLKMAQAIDLDFLF